MLCSYTARCFSKPMNNSAAYGKKDFICEVYSLKPSPYILQVMEVENRWLPTSLTFSKQFLYLE